MPLTNTAIRKAKPDAKAVRMFDEHGLYLEVAPSGGKWWRIRYTVDGKEKLLPLNTLPDTSLKKASERRDAARTQLAPAHCADLCPEARYAATCSRQRSICCRSMLASLRLLIRRMQGSQLVGRGERWVPGTLTAKPR